MDIVNFFIENWKDIIIFVSFIGLLGQLRSNTKAIKLNIESNNLTKEIIKKDTQMREIELIPKKHFIISTQVMIEGYINEIYKIILILEKINKEANNEKLINEISRFYRKKEGLLIKHDNRPIWIEEIEILATQYYYNLISCMNSFKKGNIQFNKKFSETLINRANESNFYIKKLLNYIKDMIPEVVLNCPVSIRNSDFYRK